ncbi:unnamed protein product, partial [marine sediment metagenome]
KDIQKITTFVMNNLDYTNIKNIYFSYKISEMLGVEINSFKNVNHIIGIF